MLRAANLDPAIHVEPEEVEQYGHQNNNQEEQEEVALVEHIEGVYDVPVGVQQEPGDKQVGVGEHQLQLFKPSLTEYECYFKLVG